MSVAIESLPKSEIKDTEIFDSSVRQALYEEDSQGSLIVRMFGKKLEKIAEGKQKRLFTASLMGCTAIGVVGVEHRKKLFRRKPRRVAYLRHASPGEVGIPYDGGGVEAPKIELMNGKALIMTPGQGEPFGLVESEARVEDLFLHQADVLRIALDIGQIVGKDNVTIVPYDNSRDRSDENSYAHTMLIHVPPEGSSTIVADGRIRV